MSEAPSSQPAFKAVCPLCGAGNGCAMAAGVSDSPCWCTRVSLSSASLQALFSARGLPYPAAVDQAACICEACAKSAGSA